VIVPTHPGFGGTVRPDALASIGGLAALYGALLDELELTDVTVVGNSIGGWIAAEMALRDIHGRIASMVLLNAVGIRLTMKQMERAAFTADWRAHKLKGVFMAAAGNSGNAASRAESFIQSKGAYSYGGYPDIDELYQQQTTERNKEKRKALLAKIQQLTIDRVMYAPMMDLRALMGVCPRVTKHTIADVWMSPFPSYEDIEIKG